MDWTASTWWWLGTAALVAAELATGTFYLLMFAVGTAAAALAAHTGVAFSGPLLAAALVGGGAVALWHVKRNRGPAATPVQANRDVNLDIGERVRVAHWESDGTSRVTYRGAAWSARYAGSGTPQPGEHMIRAIDGSQLLLDRVQ